MCVCGSEWKSSHKPRGRGRKRRSGDRSQVPPMRGRARDPAAAREELTNAAREAAPTQALTLAAIAMARTLPPPERVAWLGGLAHTADGAAVPGIVMGLAAAQLDADQPRDAARTLLGLARDERMPPHQRRAAANKLVRICDRLDPMLSRGALFTAAMLA